MKRSDTKYPVRRNQNGQPKINQHKIGEYEITYNPDDDRFYVGHQSEPSLGLCTHKNNTKGWANTIDRAKRFAGLLPSTSTTRRAQHTIRE